MSDLKMLDELPACNVCKEPDCKRIPAIVAWHRSGNAKAEGAVLRLETANCHGRKEAAERAAADRISDTEHERDIRGELLNAAQEAVGATWWHGIAPAIRDLESRLAAALDANAKQAAESRWVAVTDRLPALDRIVPVRTQWGVEYAQRGQDTDDSWLWADQTGEEETCADWTISHWFDLPAPPEVMK